MGGLLALGVYFLFWKLSWWISGVFNYEKNKNPLRKRKLVRLIILLSPLCISALEYIHLSTLCRNALVYFPEEKIDRPDVLITNSGSYTNDRDNFHGAEKFKYLISPFEPNNPNVEPDVELSVGNKFYENFAVYAESPPRYGVRPKPLPIKTGKKIIELARFALFEEHSFEWGQSRAKYYIYDYQKHEKIAGFSKFKQYIPQENILRSLFVIRLPECAYNHGKYTERDLNIKFLLENTFKKEMNKFGAGKND